MNIEETTVEREVRFTDEAPGGANEIEGSIDILSLIRTLLNGWRTVLGSALLVFAVATAVAFWLRPSYTSEASFIPPGVNNSGSMAAAVAGQLASMGGGDLLGMTKSPAELYSGILKSRSIASEIVNRFGLIQLYGVKKESQAEKQLNSSTAIAVDPKSSIVDLKVTQSSPQLAHNIAAAYMDALRSTEGRLALSESSQRRLFFSDQLAREKDALESAEVDLKKTEEESGLIAPAGQTDAEIRTIAQTRAEIAAREVQIAALRQSATEENPELVRRRSEVDDLKGQLERLQSGAGRSSAMAIPTSKVPELQLEYVRKAREVKYHEALFEALSKQYEAARLDEAHDAPVIQVLDPPSLPDSKSGPKRMLIMAGGLLFGLIAGSGWVLTHDALRASWESVRPRK
jgi:tyrosine-protein kinase Etk/Wzc